MMAALSVTYLLSILLQNLLCCIPIVAVLLRKSGCLAMQLILENEEKSKLW